MSDLTDAISVKHEDPHFYDIDGESWCLCHCADCVAIADTRKEFKCICPDCGCTDHETGA